MSENKNMDADTSAAAAMSNLSLHPNKRPRRTVDKCYTAKSCLGSFEILNVKNRVVTPPRPLPLRSDRSWYSDYPECRSIRNQFGYEFERKAIEIAVEHGLSQETVDASLRIRGFHYDARDVQVTLLIAVKKWTADSATVWQTVVEDVKKYVDERIVSKKDEIGLIDVSVEMVCCQLLWTKTIIGLDEEDASPKLKAAWPDIKAGVNRILEEHPCTAGHMTCITIFRLGFEGDYDKMKPKTVYISLDYGSPESQWPPVLGAVEKFVGTFDLGLRVHIEHNVIQHSVLSEEYSTLGECERYMDFSFRLVDSESMYNRAINLGDDIGAGRYIQRTDNTKISPLTGTLGCWLDVKTRTDGWKVMGLTNYHVVRPCIDGYTVGDDKPIQDSDLWNADISGLIAKSSKQINIAQVEHPSRLKHHLYMSGLKYRRDKYGEDSPKIKPALKFFKDNYMLFSSVYLASGYSNRYPRPSSNQSGRLDWSLLMPNNKRRIGTNKIPTKEAWQQTSYMGLSSTPKVLNAFGTSLKRQSIPFDEHVGTLERRMVFKVGATSCSAGKISMFASDIRVNEDKHVTPARTSTEYTIFSDFAGSDLHRGFARRGDCGAVVWDGEGTVMGMVFGVLTPQQVEDEAAFCFVTPIE
ncbi:hypothetical protein QBC34DRAFT_485984 [Podospora aff. communis PSN243]|uniref:Uncharacterized protein n=1 Tax=Podospora aff. communis PSN243 TaxID=3040156 RepID=A0AAV9GHN5_9PEZI|nr:hypothetical protein QBC34DRAFT_485984 [Podospora aff. communis PSN243]